MALSTLLARKSELKLEMAADVDAESNLFVAASKNAKECLTRLLSGEEPCKVDELDSFGQTALMLAASMGNDEAVAVLLNHGASTSLQDFESGWTALHRALFSGHVRTSLLLLKAGANLEDSAASGGASGEWREVVRPKRQWGRSLNNTNTWRSPIDHDGNSPLDLLSQQLMSRLGQAPVARYPTPDPNPSNTTLTLTPTPTPTPPKVLFFLPGFWAGRLSTRHSAAQCQKCATCPTHHNSTRRRD